MKLTQREHDTLRLMSAGASRPYAGRLMKTSASSVQRTLSDLYRRTNTQTTVELISFLITAGVLELDLRDDFPDCVVEGATDGTFDPYFGLAENRTP
jgi:DNA-binding CsgD family transcriptional regulator